MERSWTLVSWWVLLSLIGSAGCGSGGGSGPGNGTEDLSDRRAGDNRSGIDLQGYVAFGMVSGSGDAVTLPGGPTLSVSGGLKEPVTLALRPAAEEPSLDSGAIAVSDWYDTAADVNDLATGPDAPIRLSVPADPPPEAIGHPGLQLWAVLPGGVDVPLDGAFDPGTGRFTATLLGLPPSFTFAVVFREAVRRMDATEALEGGPLQSALMPDPPVGGWPATQWTLDFDGQRVTVAQAKKVLRAAMKAAAAYSSAGLKEPFLYLETTVLGPRWHIHLTAGGSSFDGNTRPAAADPAEHFGRLFVSTKRIDAASTDDLGSVLASIAHEMFHAIFRNYDIPYRCFDYEDAGRKWCYKSHTGFNEGMATAAGYFLDQGKARPRPTEDPKPLWEPVGWFDPEDRGLAYRNQDFFVYVLRIGTLNNLAAMLWSLSGASMAGVDTSLGALMAYGKALQAGNTGLGIGFGELLGSYVANRGFLREPEGHLWPDEPNGGEPGASHVLDRTLFASQHREVGSDDCRAIGDSATCTVTLDRMFPMAGYLVDVDVAALAADWGFEVKDLAASATAASGSLSFWAFGEEDGQGSDRWRVESVDGGETSLPGVSDGVPAVRVLFARGASVAPVTFTLRSQGEARGRYEGTATWSTTYVHEIYGQSTCTQDVPVVVQIDVIPGLVTVDLTVRAHTYQVVEAGVSARCVLLDLTTDLQFTAPQHPQGSFLLADGYGADDPFYWIQGTYDRDSVQGEGTRVIAPGVTNRLTFTATRVP